MMGKRRQKGKERERVEGKRGGGGGICSGENKHLWGQTQSDTNELWTNAWMTRRALKASQLYKVHMLFFDFMKWRHYFFMQTFVWGHALILQSQNHTQLMTNCSMLLQTQLRLQNKMSTQIFLCWTNKAVANVLCYGSQSRLKSRLKHLDLHTAVSVSFCFLSRCIKSILSSYLSRLW